MSLNTSHANGGVLIHNGESILLFSENVTMEFHGQDRPEFLGTKRGRLYLTTHRMIFNAKDQKEKMQSFSFPFVTLQEVEVEQPMFGANYIKGKCRAQPNGNWVGECKFKLHFKSGGAIEFGSAMLRAAQLAQRNGPDFGNDSPPPYQPPSSNWYAAPPPAYAAASNGYYGWVPPTHAFPDQPPANGVFMTDMPPPYPGINAQYATGPHQSMQGAWGGVPPTQQNGGNPAWANPSFNPNQNAAGQSMSQAGLYPNLGPQQQPQTYPQGQASPYPNQQPGPYNQSPYPAPQPGYPNASQPGYPNVPQPAYPNAPQPAYPNAPQPGYPNAPTGTYPNMQPNLYPNLGGYPGAGYPY